MKQLKSSGKYQPIGEQEPELFWEKHLLGDTVELRTEGFNFLSSQVKGPTWNAQKM